MACSFCGADTSFLAHSPALCLPCGDAVCSYKPEQVLELAKRLADCGAAYGELLQDSHALHKAVDEIPVEHWTDAVKVAMPCLAFTRSEPIPLSGPGVHDVNPNTGEPWTSEDLDNIVVDFFPEGK